MFPTWRTSQILQRASGALAQLRSLLLLERDSDVDWEVGRELAQHFEHPHRAPLRGAGLSGRGRARRPGAVAGEPQVCISPVHAARAASQLTCGGSRRRTGAARCARH